MTSLLIRSGGILRHVGGVVEQRQAARRRSESDLFTAAKGTEIVAAEAQHSIMALTKPTGLMRRQTVVHRPHSSGPPIDGLRTALLGYAKATQGRFTWVFQYPTFIKTFGVIFGHGEPPAHPSYITRGDGFFLLNCDLRDRVMESEATGEAISQLAANATMNCMEYIYLGLVEAGVTSSTALRAIFKWEDIASATESEWFAPLGTHFRRPFSGREQSGDLVFFEQNGAIKHVAILGEDVKVHQVYQLYRSQAGVDYVSCNSVAERIKKYAEDMAAVSVTYVPFRQTVRAFQQHAEACLVLAHATS